MNFENLNYYFNKIVLRWLTVKPLIKILILSLILIIPITSILIMTQTSSGRVLLYSADQMKNVDLPRIKEVLDNLKIPYSVTENNLILVPSDKEQYLRSQLALYGLPKPKQDKGYELFDSSTWIKGEKELQVLELRALKGQLERDLEQFDNIRSAYVILDVPPNRSFSGNTPSAKASVILDLIPGARITPGQLRAITYHLSSAVRGLDPNHVAISDTTGKLYQGLDSDESQDVLRTSEIAAEDYIRSKIDGMLTAIVGSHNFYTNVQVSLNRNNVVEERKIYSGTVNGVSLGQPVISQLKKTNDQQNKFLDELINNKPLPDTSKNSKVDEIDQISVPVDYVKISSTPGKIASLSIGVVIDQGILNGQYDQAKLKTDIENQLKTILKGYEVPIYQSVDFVPFYRDSHNYKTIIPIVHAENTPQIVNFYLIIAFTTAALLIGFILLITFRRSKSNKDLTSSPNLETMLDNLEAKFHKNSSQEKGKNVSLFQLLSSTEPRHLAELLTGESPETVALLFCHLNEPEASQVFSEMSLKTKKAILLAFNELDMLGAASLSTLLQQTAKAFGTGYQFSLPSLLNKAASLFSQLKTEEIKFILNELEKTNSEYAKRLSKQLNLDDKTEEQHKGISV